MWFQNQNEEPKMKFTLRSVLTAYERSGMDV